MEREERLGGMGGKLCFSAKPAVTTLACTQDKALSGFTRCSNIGKRVASRMQQKKTNIPRVFLAQFVFFFVVPAAGRIVADRNGRKVGKSSGP